MSRKQPHILLIDDNRHGLIARRDALEEKGFLVKTAASGASGVRAFQQGEFDLVVTDFKMPRMGGREVLVAIRELSPQTPVAILSGCVEQLGLKEELLQEADAVLLKGPSELDDLLRTAARLIRPRPSTQKKASNSRSKRKKRA